jgi:uncharacterized protein YkwD
MHAGLQRATCGWAVVLGAGLLASCGDAAGNPIRNPEPDAALLRKDAGDGMLDAASSASLPVGSLPPKNIPTGSPNESPGSMYDGRSTDGVPHIAYCANAANWPRDLEDDEATMEQAINQTRSRISCGDNGNDEVQLPRLRIAPELRCSARLHSLDMVFNRYSDTRGSDGSQPGTRMTKAGFAHDASAESIGQGHIDDVLFDLLGNPDDCGNLASRQFTAVGVGEYAGLWTLDFAADP